MTAFGREEIGTQKIKKQFFAIYLETWRGAKLGIFTHFIFTNFPRCSQYELTNICILYTDPQLITLLRSTAAQKKFLYYPVIGLRFWTLNFHQQGQGFHSVREVREFARGSEKVRKFEIFWRKSGKVSEENFYLCKSLTLKKMCSWIVYDNQLYIMLLFASSINMI